MAGVDIESTEIFTLTTGGILKLVVDQNFAIPPSLGLGKTNIPNAILTGGTGIKVYTFQQDFNILPATLNGAPYIPGPEFINTATDLKTEISSGKL